MLHPDGQYEPTLIPSWSSRSSTARPTSCSARGSPSRAWPARAGCRCYKYVANRVLTTIENRVMGTELSELHTGYRAYSRELLLDVPFLRNALDFSFDSEMLMQAVALRLPDRRGARRARATSTTRRRSASAARPSTG